MMMLKYVGKMTTALNIRTGKYETYLDHCWIEKTPLHEDKWI